jgi:hypothetical protein
MVCSALLALFTILQIVLLLLITLHDWIDIPPFTDIATFRLHHSVIQRITSSFFNGILVATPLALTVYYKGPIVPFWVRITIISIYIVLTIGALCAWWIPYFFGSSHAHKQGFIEYKNTHTFLPNRGDNVVPNTFHVLLHILIVLCLFLSYQMYFMITP